MIDHFLRCPALLKSTMTTDDAFGNSVIDVLPAKTRRSIAPLLKPIVIARGTVTTRAGDRITHVDFPVDAVIAVIATTPRGRTVEVAAIGSEGYVETDAPLQSPIASRSAICRFPGRVLRMSTDDFQRALQTKLDFLHAIRRATHARFFITEQTVLCNVHHSMDQRLARWLLIARDRSRRDHFMVTQAELAGVLGVRRAGISLTVARLRRAGAITSVRGGVVVADYDRLLDESCECYGMMREAIRLEWTPNA
jgi:CRP-like cAMP-binding protein